MSLAFSQNADTVLEHLEDRQVRSDQHVRRPALNALVHEDSPSNSTRLITTAYIFTAQWLL
jgi:hypothetical protein